MKDWKFYAAAVVLIGIIIGASVTQCAEAAEPAFNVRAVEEGTSARITWEHDGVDVEAFRIWTTNKYASPLLPPDARSYLVTNHAQYAECSLYVKIVVPDGSRVDSQTACIENGATGDETFAGSKRVNWTPPTEREDGSPLAPSEIYGYEVFYDTVSPPDSGQVQNVNDGTAKTHLITDLPPATWYAGVKTVDTEQQVSDLSNIVSFTIEEEPLPGDTTPPVITLLGDNPMTMRVRTAYEEPGANCTDDVDGTLNAVITGDVNMAQVGEYHTTYTCTDAAGNIATEQRTVQVIPRGKPKAPTSVE